MKKTLSLVLSLLMILTTLTALPFTALALETYDITVGVANDEDCGTVSGGATVNEGEEITLTATPKTNYRFVYWVNNYGEVKSNESTYSFTASYDATLTAIFKTHTHTMSAVAAKAATCTEAGRNAYYYCAGCNKVFKDAAGTQETTVAAETIPATGKHTWNAGTVTKTTATTYTKTFTCKVCGAKATKTYNKSANTLTAKAKKPTVKFSKLKKKNQTIAAKSAITVSKAQGKVTYKKSSGNKKITVASNGKITVKKGLKKGTYKVKIKVTAAGNATYKATTKTVTVTIKVK